MRKHKIVQIDEQTKITVQELTVGQIIDLQEKAAKLGGKEITLGMLKDLAQEYLPSCVNGLNFDKLRDLAPSELKELAKTFQEVNADFLEMLDWLGIKQKFMSAVKSDFANLSQSSSEPATGTLPNTATASSALRATAQ